MNEINGKISKSNKGFDNIIRKIVWLCVRENMFESMLAIKKIRLYSICNVRRTGQKKMLESMHPMCICN